VAKDILITGGAGFIGSHLTEELLAAGHRVRVFDNLLEQVHGPGRNRPEHLSLEAELVVGDVRDAVTLKKALKGIDAVFHLAAMVGVGQSMYQVTDYVAANDLGTANLLQALIEHPVERLVVASSMSIYGEGLYLYPDGTPAEVEEREISRLKEGEWEVKNRQGIPLVPVPTPENKRPNPSSVYALSKYTQERLCLMVGQAYGTPSTALRFFNAYGPRQSLLNPYTGVLAIFASRLLNNHAPIIFEDGGQKRDFVHVSDVARACRLAMEIPNAGGKVFNVGSGTSCTVLHAAETLTEILGKSNLRPEITGRLRVGDIRHCFADILLSREVLGYRPKIDMEDGMVELAEWLSEQTAVDRFEEASRELAYRGLMV